VHKISDQRIKVETLEEKHTRTMSEWNVVDHETQLQARLNMTQDKYSDITE
jgi:hypothetical protein